MKKIDMLAKWIIRTLQNDGKMPIRNLAKRAGIRQQSMAERIDRMKKNNLITGFTITVDEKKLGWNITALAVVALECNRNQQLVEFEDTVKGMPEILECHMIKGSADFFIKFVARDTEHEDLIVRKIAELENVRSIRSYETIRCAFSRGPDPGYE